MPNNKEMTKAEILEAVSDLAPQKDIPVDIIHAIGSRYLRKHPEYVAGGFVRNRVHTRQNEARLLKHYKQPEEVKGLFPNFSNLADFVENINAQNSNGSLIGIIVRAFEIKFNCKIDKTTVPPIVTAYTGGPTPRTPADLATDLKEAIRRPIKLTSRKNKAAE